MNIIYYRQEYKPDTNPTMQTGRDGAYHVSAVSQLDNVPDRSPWRATSQTGPAMSDREVNCNVAFMDYTDRSKGPVGELCV